MKSDEYLNEDVTQRVRRSVKSKSQEYENVCIAGGRGIPDID